MASIDLAPWVWAPNISNMWYTGPDKGNSWASTLRNIMINAQGGYAQKPGAVSPTTLDRMES